MNDLRKAAEMALEALEEACEIVGRAWSWRDEKGRPAAEALRQALTQPEQENYVTEVVAVSENGIRTVKQTTIPKKEWVGLTDEERDFFRGIGLVGTDIIEAKLKEKNGG